MPNRSGMGRSEHSVVMRQSNRERDDDESDTGSSFQRYSTKKSRRQIRSDGVSFEDDDEESSESAGEESESEEDSADGLSTTSSLSVREQMEFREKKRAEHRRWLQKRKKEKQCREDPKAGSDDDWDDYETVDRAKAGKVKSRRPEKEQSRQSQSQSTKGTKTSSKKGGFFGFFRRAKADPMSEMFSVGPVSVEESQRLPWEDRKVEENMRSGLIGRAAAKLRPQQTPVRSVNDLPFPRSESMDGSLADYIDRYRDIHNEYPMFTQDDGKDVKQVSGAPSAASLSTMSNDGKDRKKASTAHSIASVSTMSNTLPDRLRRKPISRAKMGLTNKLKGLFLKQY